MRQQGAKACAATAGLAPPHGWLQSSRRAALPRTAPRPLCLLSTLDVIGGADSEQTSGWLGFGGEGPALDLIVGGR
jgi:hypothetical protein